MMKKFSACSIALALYVLSTSGVQATLMDFKFDLTFSSGLLSGQVITGEFTVDGYTGTGLEVFCPAGSNQCGAAAGSLTAFNVVIEGFTFDMTIEDLYPDYPVIKYR